MYRVLQTNIQKYKTIDAEHSYKNSSTDSETYPNVRSLCKSNLLVRYYLHLRFILLPIPNLRRLQYLTDGGTASPMSVVFRIGRISPIKVIRADCRLARVEVFVHAKLLCYACVRAVPDHPLITMGRNKIS